MRYFFILGRNPELSRAEVYSYLVGRRIEFKELLFKNNFLVIDTFNKNKTILDIQKFGGVLKLGDILFSGKEEELGSFLEKDDLTEKEKFTYSVFGNFHEAEDYLRDKFKKERRKAIIRHGRKNLKLQEGDYVSLSNSDVEFFSFNDEGEIYFGVAQQDYSYENVKKRDMKKPVRREGLAISPRLAKIMINLSQVKEGQLMLDAFCGVGGILQEALIQGVNVYGIDKDSAAIENSKRNLKWLKENFKIDAEYVLIHDNSKQAPDKRFDAIVSETPLGFMFRKKPKENEVRQVIFDFERSIVPILNRMRNIKKPLAKIVLTMPCTENMSVRIDDICYRTGLRISNIKNIKMPIKEFRPDQFISREIVVLD